MIEQAQVSVKKIVDTIGRIYQDCQWVLCPLCDEEWTKLHPVLLKENDKREVVWMCVECSESLKSFEQIVNLYPFVPKANNWHEPTFKYREPIKINNIPMWRMKWVVINYKPSGDKNLKLTVHCGGGKIRVKADEETDVATFDDILHAWFHCKFMMHDNFSLGDNKAKVTKMERL